MSTIAKAVGGRMRRHAEGADSKPKCGGGNGARSAAYQVDLGDDVDCEKCLRLLELEKFPWMRAKRGSWRIKPSETEPDRFGIWYKPAGAKWQFACATILAQGRFARLIIEGLNAIYPPQSAENRAWRN